MEKALKECCNWNSNSLRAMHILSRWYIEQRHNIFFLKIYRNAWLRLCFHEKIIDYSIGLKSSSYYLAGDLACRHLRQFNWTLFVKKICKNFYNNLLRMILLFTTIVVGTGKFWTLTIFFSTGCIRLFYAPIIYKLLISLKIYIYLAATLNYLFSINRLNISVLIFYYVSVNLPHRQ